MNRNWGMKIVSSQIDGPIGSVDEDQAAGRWNSTPALPWATAAMGRQKDAFTYLQAGSKPKALEIAQSADLRQMNERGQSLMFAAAGRPLSKGSAELLCQILQKRGLAVDALDGHNQTPLFAAAREGNETCADWLIAQGCAVDHADFRGETPLCIAFRNSQMGMVMKLLKHGASLGVKDMYGGRQPTFFADPIFRKTFAEKRKEPPETTSSTKKRKRGQAESLLVHAFASLSNSWSHGFYALLHKGFALLCFSTNTVWDQSSFPWKSQKISKIWFQNIPSK